MSEVVNEATPGPELLSFQDLSEGMLVDVLAIRDPGGFPSFGWISTIVHEKTGDHVILGKWAQVPGAGDRFMGITARPCDVEKQFLVKKPDGIEYLLRVRKTDLKLLLGSRGRGGPELE